MRQASPRCGRSEEHTSELQSRRDLVCRLLLEKKKDICDLRRRDLRDRERIFLLGDGRLDPGLLTRNEDGLVVDKALDQIRPLLSFFLSYRRRPPRPKLFPYTTLFR